MFKSSGPNALSVAEAVSSRTSSKCGSMSSDVSCERWKSFVRVVSLFIDL
jgi:hypothetical protein